MGGASPAPLDGGLNCAIAGDSRQLEARMYHARKLYAPYNVAAQQLQLVPLNVGIWAAESGASWLENVPRHEGGETAALRAQLEAKDAEIERLKQQSAAPGPAAAADKPRIHRFANGDVYEGEYVDGLKEGLATYKLVNGDIFVGEYRRGKKAGWGTYRYPDGENYEGEWHDDKQQGRGTYRYADGIADVGRYEAGGDAPVGEAVRWSADRQTAWLMRDGDEVEKLTREEAARITTTTIGLPVPLPINVVGTPTPSPAARAGGPAGGGFGSQPGLARSVGKGSSAQAASQQAGEDGGGGALPPASIGIIQLDEPQGGHDGGASGADYAVHRVLVSGLTHEMCLAGALPPEVEQRFLAAIGQLEEAGVCGISSDSGAAIGLQPLARKATSLPVFMTALCQLQAICSAFAPHEKVGILTADVALLSGHTREQGPGPGQRQRQGSLRDLAWRECGVDTADERFVSIGCAGLPGFDSPRSGQRADRAALQPALLQAVRRAIEETPQLRALLLECTHLAPFSAALRRATGLPVYDATTARDFFISGMRAAELSPQAEPSPPGSDAALLSRRIDGAALAIEPPSAEPAIGALVGAPSGSPQAPMSPTGAPPPPSPPVGGSRGGSPGVRFVDQGREVAMRSPPPVVEVPRLQVSTPPPSGEAAPETPPTERERYLQKLREERKLWKRESSSPRPGSATIEVRAERPKPLTPKELFLQGVRRERESAARARLRMAAQDAMVGRRMSTSELDRLGNASPHS